MYIAYALLAAFLFALLPLRRAILASYVGGWLALPVGSYADYQYGFTVELIGNALPAPAMLVAKAWVAPLVTLILAIVRDRRRLLAWRPGWIDLPMASWCLWPLIVGMLASRPSPAPMMSSLYLAAAWGAPWLLARVYLGDDAGRLDLAKGLAMGALVIAPLGLAEGMARPFVHQALYGPHPFVSDGTERYIGFRPLLMFENGNQYGIFMALAAVAAVAAWRQERSRTGAICAAILVCMAVLSQSAGAILLMVAGLFVLLIPVRGPHVRRAAIGIAALCVLIAPLYVSGVLPIERFVRHTATGQKLLAAVRATGRGSIAWRVSQDQKVASLVRQHPLVGTSRWDWWRPSKTRPWNLALLIIGQFGLLALLAVGAILIVGSMQTILASPSRPIVAQGLAWVTLLAALDALLNSFVFLPALLTAGALPSARWDGARTRAGAIPPD